jgi:hypothetical protein
MQQRLTALENGSGGKFNTSPADMPMMMGRKGDMRWFDTGPILLLTQDPNSRLEVRVAKENLQGDRDDLELSFDMTMNGESHEGGASRVLLTMQKEDGIWRLSEVGLTFKMKLDGSFIDAFSKQMKSMSGGTTVSTLTPTPTEVPSRSMPARELSASEKAALDGLRQMLAAQTQYRSANSTVGFSCDAADLNVTQTSGYRTMIVGCKGTPVTSFKITVTPMGMGSKGQRAFCSDESGEIRYSDDGRGISCLSEKNRIE